MQRNADNTVWNATVKIRNTDRADCCSNADRNRTTWEFLAERIFKLSARAQVSMLGNL
jgi:hypothetical protein